MPRIRKFLPLVGRMAVTLVVIGIAIVGGRTLWRHYQVEPWTRDGRVRADVVQIAPDVSGLVTRVEVINDQPVRRGQPLFTIDRDRFELALRQADATLAAQTAVLAQARREAARNAGLGPLVAGEVAEQAKAKVEEDQAALAQARGARDIAALNLERTTILAPTDGYLSDSSLRVGDYVTAGKPVLGLIDSASFRVEGYFEETKLKGVSVGQAVSIRVMGEPTALRGHVSSIAVGIEDRERGGANGMLPNINPTFSWVRLAQRVPVRIALDEAPKDLRLISGRTVTVVVLKSRSTRTAGL